MADDACPLKGRTAESESVFAAFQPICPYDAQADKKPENRVPGNDPCRNREHPLDHVGDKHGCDGVAKGFVGRVLFFATQSKQAVPNHSKHIKRWKSVPRDPGRRQFPEMNYAP